jgi:protein tyrosine phosphatase (PTP) superfamily phosphohydrolase (DUF442 family)
MIRTLGLLLFASAVFVNVGCQNTCNRPLFCGRNDPPPAKAIFVPPAPLVQPGPIQQSGGFPIVPQGAVVNPPPGANIVQPNPGPSPSISKSPPERKDTQWLPGETREPESRRDVPPRIQLYAPEPIDREVPKSTDEPPLKKPSVQRSFPAIPQFAEAKDNVFAGLRPPLDGLDWLQTNGVKTVVQIRLFGEDDSAVRKEVESRNMSYVAFEVSPVTLTKEKSDDFVKLIRDRAKQGIFVYDQDGSLAGSMWYLYMRHGEVLDDDASQLRARALGLNHTRDDQSREMWLAVQKLLSENSR